LPFKEADGVLPSALPLVGTEIADKQMWCFNTKGNGVSASFSIAKITMMRVFCSTWWLCGPLDRSPSNFCSRAPPYSALNLSTQKDKAHNTCSAYFELLKH
jgi:hypothetical protein